MSQFPTTQPAKGSFPIRRARMAPPTVGPSVPASLDTETGEGAAAARITRTGTGLMSFGLDALAKLKAAQDEIDLSTKKREYDEIMANALLAAQQAPDEEAAQAIMVEAQKQAEALEEGITSGTVMRGLQMHHDRIKPRWEATIKLGILKQQVDNLKASAEVNMAKDLAINTDESLARVEATLNTLYENGIINDSQRDEGIANKEFNGAISQSAVLARTNPDAAMKLVENLKGSTPRQERQINDAINYALKQKQTQETIEDENEQKRFLTFYEMMTVEGRFFKYWELTDELTKENALKMYEIQDKLIKARAAGNDKLLREGDPRTKARVTAAITLNPNAVVRSKLLSADMMEALGYDNVKGFVQFLDQEREKQDPRAKRYYASLERLRQAEVFGKQQQGELNYLDAVRNFREFLKTDPADKALEEFYKQLLLTANRETGWLSSSVPKGVIPGITDAPKQIEVDGQKVWVKNLDVITINGKRYRVEAKEGKGYDLIPAEEELRR